MLLVASEIMTPHIKSVPQSWTMHKFAAFLSDNGISGSPVMNDTGDIIGIATLSDIAAFHLNQAKDDYESQMTPEEKHEARRMKQFLFEEMSNMPVEVRDIMTPILFSVEEQTAIEGVARIMMKEHLHRIFVKKDGKVVGIITTYDLLRVICERGLGAEQH